ncbi:type II toxin-antitoxin system mRNA interferase toxin, RelE/StbE family [Patescibacteria group bacterium]|nr:type II toxin-antitoxin system mRNA interferase toxin, RelE/StbE family [Patescibacteria group bacterium]
MEVFFTKTFRKKFNKMPVKIQQKFEERIDIFIKNPIADELRVHSLKGNLVGYRAFSVTGDYRVIFKIIGPNKCRLIDIGTHNQVY